MTGATTDTLSYPAASNRISNVLTGVTTTRTFTHDGAGNIATDTRSGSTFTYGHNARGRLATVSQDGNLKGTYVYNSLEQLASRVVTNSGAFNGTVHTVQDRSGNVIAEADGATGVVAKEYIWLPGAGYAGTDLPVGVVDVAGTATPELLYVHADHLGRPIRLTDPAKVTAWAVEWLPWGGVHSISGSETLNARFPGQWFQVESGLHYNWHRHYDPTIGRYTQPDPLGFVDGPSVYAYARNAPGEFVDPDGRFVPLIIPIIAGIGGGVAYDYTISQIKSECGCGSSGSTAGPLGNAAVGAGTGLTGPYVEKPRTGIAGGGRSGNRTSVLSTIGGSRVRTLGRIASYGIPGLGGLLAAKDVIDIVNCLRRQ